MRPSLLYAVALVLFNICILGIHKSAECHMILVVHPTRANNVTPSKWAAILNNEPKEKRYVISKGYWPSIILAEADPDTLDCMFDIGDYFTGLDNICRQKGMRRLYHLRAFIRSACPPVRKSAANPFYYGGRPAKIAYRTSDPIPAFSKLNDGVFDTYYKDVGALYLCESALSNPDAPAGDNPQADRGASQNQRGDVEKRNPHKEGLTLSALIIGIGAFCFGLIVTLGITWWRGWLR